MIDSPGRIVILNGAPRAGKSSIVTEIQETFDGAWMNLGVDVARAMTPPRCQPGIGLRPGEEAHPAFPFVPVLYAALYESIAAHSRAGLDVVADMGHHDAEVLRDCARRLVGLPVLLVGVRCPIEVIMERRNASPAGRYAQGSEDRPIPDPVSRLQEAVHDPGVYDLEVDTSILSPKQCAAAIRERLEDPTPARAIQRLASEGNSDRLPESATWDGLPVANEPPYASCVVVWRTGRNAREFLVLHRLAPGGIDFEGDWAWTPPSGARQPGETPDEAAARELREETGLSLPLVRLADAPSDEVALYTAELAVDAEVVLDAEHDRATWLPIDEAVRLCLPPRVAECLTVVASSLPDWRG